MDESEEYKWALKVVIKRQMRDLLEQLHESGEEVAVLSVNIEKGTCSHFGSSQGEWFLLEQQNLTNKFLKHCQRHKHRKDTRKSVFRGTSDRELTSTLGSPTMMTRSKGKTTESSASVAEVKEEGEVGDVDAYADVYNDIDQLNNTADTDDDYIPDDDSVKDPDFSLTEEIKVAPIAVATTPGLTGRKKNIIGNRKHKLPRIKKMRDVVKIQCTQCPMVIQSAKGMKVHVDRVHLNIRKSKCEVCPKSFWSNCTLQEHMLAVHTRRCDACKQYVVEATPWTENMTNRTVRNVLCVCGATVSICTNLGCPKKYLDDDEPDENGEVKKRRRYRSDASFACGVCHKLFSQQKACEQHQIRHTGLKAYVCHLCGTSFTHVTSLRRHMNRIHNTTDNVCKICNRPYANATALTLHNVKFHSGKVNTDDAVGVKENSVVDTETCNATPNV